MSSESSESNSVWEEKLTPDLKPSDTAIVVSTYTIVDPKSKREPPPLQSSVVHRRSKKQTAESAVVGSPFTNVLSIERTPNELIPGYEVKFASGTSALAPSLDPKNENPASSFTIAMIKFGRQKRRMQAALRRFCSTFWRFARFGRRFRVQEPDETKEDYNRKFYLNTFDMWKRCMCLTLLPLVIILQSLYFYRLAFYGGDMIVVIENSNDNQTDSNGTIHTNITVGPKVKFEEPAHEREHRLALADFPQPEALYDRLMISNYQPMCVGPFKSRLMPSLLLPRALLFALTRDERVSDLGKVRKMLAGMLFGKQKSTSTKYPCACAAHTLRWGAKYIAFRRSDFQSIPESLLVSSSDNYELIEVFNPVNPAQLEYDTMPVKIPHATEQLGELTVVRHSQAALFKITAEMRFIDNTSDVDVVRQRRIHLEGMGLDGNPIPTLNIVDDMAYAVAECLDMLDGRSIWQRAALQASRGLDVNAAFKTKLISMFGKECDKPDDATHRTII
jgi:hypothetical protein